MAIPVSPSPAFPSPSPPSIAEESTGGLWYVGAIINVVGSVSINLGMNLMKLGHTRRAQLDIPESEKPPIRKFKVWLFGIIIFITGNILNFVSFAFAAQSLLAALGSLQLVCNVFFAYFVNHEPVTKLIILSTTCIIGGCVLLVVFGNQSSETYTVDQLVKFYTYPAYVVYLVMTAVFVFGFYVLYLHSKKVCRKRGEKGCWYGMMLTSYAIFSALLGSQSVLFGKSISVILRTTFTESNQLGNWYTWVVLPLFAFTALFWVTRLNKGLRMFPAMVIVPLLQIAWTLFSIVAGMLYFQEYTGFTTLKAIMFPVGVLIVFLGVFLLTVCGGGKSPAVEEAGEVEEEGSIKTKTSVYDNAMFSARSDGDGQTLDTPFAAPGGPQQQQAKISLGQTLRLISTWAPPSVAVSPGSNMNRTLATNESLQQQYPPRGRRTGGPSDLNATGLTSRTEELSPATSVGPGEQHPGGGGGGWGNRSLEKISSLNRTAQSNTSRISDTSMVSTMRRGLKSVGSRLTNDMGLDMSGFKLAVGLGDSNLSGVSLFTMPALDFTAATKRKSEHRISRTGPRASDVSILTALPGSRFYRADPDGLTVIREGSGAPGTTKGPSPELGASLTTSSQMPASSGGSHGAAAARGPAAAVAVANTSSPEASRRSPGQQQQRTASPSPARSPAKPLTEAALLSLLPVPSFQTSRQASTPDMGQSSEPKTSAPASPPRRGGAAAAMGSAGSPPGSGGRVQRSRRSSAMPETGLPLPPGFRMQPVGPGPGGRRGSAAMPQSGYDSDAYPATWGPSAAAAAAAAAAMPPQQYRSPGPGGISAAYEAGGGPTGGAPRGPRGGSISKPGSLGALLPEGVPLSTANSVVMHESGLSTPPDALMQHQQQQQQQQQMERFAGAGYGAGAGYAGPRPQSPWQQSPTPTHRPPPLTPSQQLSAQQQMSLQQQLSMQQQLSLQQQLSMQQQQQISLQQQAFQHQQQHVPLSLMQRSQAPHMVGSARLPALHLIVPGLPVSPSQLVQPAAGSGYLPYGTSSMSYAQMLAGQGFSDTGMMLAGQGQPLAGSMSLGGAPTGVAPTAVRVQGRSQSPYGLSVSRSWAGLSGMSAGGAAAARQSPLRGTLVGQMQRPLRPWQN